MECRPISEREFVNYAKGLGNYCTYSDTLKLLEAVFKGIKQAMGSGADALGNLLPASVRPVWDKAEPAGVPGDTVIDLIQNYGGFPTERDAEKALVTLFGTIKEKQAQVAGQWRELLPSGMKLYWEKSRTIDEVQDAGQCL